MSSRRIFYAGRYVSYCCHLLSIEYFCLFFIHQKPSAFIVPHPLRTLAIRKYLSYIPSGGYFTLPGIFLLGYYLASIGFFKEKSKSTFVLILCLIIGLLATLSARILGGSPYRFPPTLTNILFKFLLSAGQIFMCMFYMTSIFKIVQTSIGKRVFKHLIPVERMALSNYLFQTVMLMIIFYNFGFNLFGRVGLITTSGIAFLILIVQIIFSNIWLRHFRFGPLEWLWRCLTYKRRMKIRNDNVEYITLIHFPGTD